LISPPDFEQQEGRRARRFELTAPRSGHLFRELAAAWRTPNVETRIPDLSAHSLVRAALIEAWNEERNGDRQPDEERRVIGIIAAVVVAPMIVATLPVAPVVSSVCVVAMSPVVVVSVVISAASGMNSGVTGMDGTGVRRSNTDGGNQDEAQGVYSFHGIYCYSTHCPQALGVFHWQDRYAFRPN
jgi:hypothetical protein